MTMTTAASGEAGQRPRRSQEACREDKHLKQLQRKTVIITLMKMNSEQSLERERKQKASVKSSAAKDSDSFQIKK